MDDINVTPQNEHIEERFQRLQQRYNELVTENEQLNQNVSSREQYLMAENRILINEIKSLTGSLQQSEREIDRLNEQIRRQNAAILNDINEIAVLTTDICDSQSSINDRRDTIMSHFNMIRDRIQEPNYQPNHQTNRQRNRETEDNEEAQISAQQKFLQWVNQNNLNVDLAEYANTVRRMEYDNSLDAISDEISNDILFDYLFALYHQSQDNPFKSILFYPLKSLTVQQIQVLRNDDNFDPSYLSPCLIRFLMDLICEFTHLIQKMDDVCYINEKLSEGNSETPTDVVNQSTINSKKLFYLILNQLNKKMEFREGVRKIDSFLFKGQRNIEHLILPKSLTTICTSAFLQCSNLRSVDLRCVNLERIGKYAFCGCSQLTKFEVPNGIKVIEQGSFRECTALETFTFPPYLKEIQDEAFCGCSSLTEAFLPQTVLKIGKSAFQNCSNLRSFHISGVISLGSTWDAIPNAQIDRSDITFTIPAQCFEGCTSVAFLLINKIEELTISKNAFRKCSSITRVTIQLSNETTINDSAFEDCTGLNMIKFVTNQNESLEIKKSVFKNCNSIREIVFPPNSNVASCDYLFDGCTCLQSVRFRDNLTEISTGIFRNCSN